MSATLIDHIYSKLTCRETLSGIILTDVADHFGTFYIVNESNSITDKPPLLNVYLLKPTWQNFNNCYMIAIFLK